MAPEPKPRILVAEDDPRIREGLVDLLESEGYRVTAAGDGSEAESLLETQDFDLTILDIMMPGKSGYDLCRDIRAGGSQIPVIMLTAKGEEIDKVVGLKLGADDYVTKPFGVHELLARVDAVLRRALRSAVLSPEIKEKKEVFRFGDARIYPDRYRSEIGGATENLSAKELALILFFHEHAGRVISRDEVLDAVWGINYFGTTRTLDQHVARVRKKIEKDSANPRFLTTVHGVGYRYEEPEKD
jgi:DNA-binding response OmpR family regulator